VVPAVVHVHRKVLSMGLDNANAFDSMLDAGSSSTMRLRSWQSLEPALRVYIAHSAMPVVLDSALLDGQLNDLPETIVIVEDAGGRIAGDRYRSAGGS
jgi:hypothetical protein